MISRKYIGLVLRACRKEIQLSQVEMGEVLQISPSTINQVESGDVKIAFHKIQDYLGAYRLNS